MLEFSIMYLGFILILGILGRRWYKKKKNHVLKMRKLKKQLKEEISYIKFNNRK
tara:strand:+ start:171 stop:332 length:162 start_codon:yes stop_codon:yes gene_type:complete